MPIRSMLNLESYLISSYFIYAQPTILLSQYQLDLCLI